MAASIVFMFVAMLAPGSLADWLPSGRALRAAEEAESQATVLTMGRFIDLDEIGYKAVAALENDGEMEAFASRVVENLCAAVANENKFRGMIPFFSGRKMVQTLAAMKKEFQTKAVQSGAIRMKKPDECPAPAPPKQKTPAPPEEEEEKQEALSERSFPTGQEVGAKASSLLAESTTEWAQAAFAVQNYSTKKEQLARGHHIQIMGLFDTGTNLLKAVIEENFHHRVRVYDMYQPHGLYWRMAHERECYTLKAKGFEVCSFWKHANLDVIKARSGDRLEQNRRLGVVGIAMVREPLAWFQGIRKAPYDYQHPPRNDVHAANWLTRNFTTSESFYGGDPAITFPSLGDIWNNHTRAYEHLDKYGFDRRLVVKYEELVLDTESAVRKIAEVLGVPCPTNITQVEVPAKDGISGGHAEAVEKLKSKSHVALYSKEELRQACDSLDRPLMRRHGYGLCDRLVPLAVQQKTKSSDSKANMATSTKLPKPNLTASTKHQPNHAMAAKPQLPAMAKPVPTVSTKLQKGDLTTTTKHEPNHTMATKPQTPAMAKPVPTVNTKLPKGDLTTTKHEPNHTMATTPQTPAMAKPVSTVSTKLPTGDLTTTKHEPNHTMATKPQPPAMAKPVPTVNTKLPNGDLTTATDNEPNHTMATKPQTPAMAKRVSMVSTFAVAGHGIRVGSTGVSSLKSTNQPTRSTTGKQDKAKSAQGASKVPSAKLGESKLVIDVATMPAPMPGKGAAGAVSDMSSETNSANSSERRFAKNSKQSATAKSGTLKSTGQISTGAAAKRAAPKPAKDVRLPKTNPSKAESAKVVSELGSAKPITRKSGSTEQFAKMTAKRSKGEATETASRRDSARPSASTQAKHVSLSTPPPGKARSAQKVTKFGFSPSVASHSQSKSRRRLAELKTSKRGMKESTGKVSGRDLPRLGASKHAKHVQPSKAGPAKEVTESVFPQSIASHTKSKSAKQLAKTTKTKRWKDESTETVSRMDSARFGASNHAKRDSRLTTQPSKAGTAKEVSDSTSALPTASLGHEGPAKKRKMTKNATRGKAEKTRQVSSSDKTVEATSLSSMAEVRKPGTAKAVSGGHAAKPSRSINKTSSTAKIAEKSSGKHRATDSTPKGRNRTSKTQLKDPEATKSAPKTSAANLSKSGAVKDGHKLPKHQRHHLRGPA